MGVNIPVGFGQLSMDVRLAGDAQPMTTTWGFDYTTPSPDPVVMADTFFTIATGTGAIFELSQQWNQYTIGPFRVTVSTNTGYVAGTGTLFGQGTSVQNPLPQNCAWLIQKRTARGGRSGRGRAFLPPTSLQEGQVDPAGNIPTATRAAFQTRVNLFRTDAATNNLSLVLLHDGATTPDVITALQVDSRIATQRTRLRP